MLGVRFSLRLRHIKTRHGFADEENRQARWLDRNIATQSIPLCFMLSVPAIFLCTEKQSTGLFFCVQTFRSSILSKATPQKIRHGFADEENPQAYLGLRVHPTQFVPLRFTNSVPVCTICAEKQFTGLFFNAQTFRSSILSEATPQKIRHGFAVAYFLCKYDIILLSH